MNTKLFNVFMFATGAVVGSVVTWKVIKNKFALIDRDELYDAGYDDIYEEEEDECESDLYEDVVSEPVAPTNAVINPVSKKPSLKEYTKMVEKEGYTNYSALGGSAEKLETNDKEGEPVDEPYVISPNDFGELDGYETISLTYYANGVLTDDQDNIIDNVDEVIGMEALSHFGEYEDDSVFVRNDERKCDYEILLDYRSYEDS